MINDISIYLKVEHIEFLIIKISEIDPKLLTNDEIELLFQISRYSAKGGSLINTYKLYLFIPQLHIKKMN